MEHRPCGGQELGAGRGRPLQGQQSGRHAPVLERLGHSDARNGGFAFRPAFRALRLHRGERRRRRRMLGDLPTRDRGALLAYPLEGARDARRIEDADDDQPHDELDSRPLRAGRRREQGYPARGRILRALLGVRQSRHRFPTNLRGGSEQDQRSGHQGTSALRQLGLCRSQRHGHIQPFRRLAPSGAEPQGTGV